MRRTLPLSRPCESHSGEEWNDSFARFVGATLAQFILTIREVSGCENLSLVELQKRIGECFVHLSKPDDILKSTTERSPETGIATISRVDVCCGKDDSIEKREIKSNPCSTVSIPPSDAMESVRRDSSMLKSLQEVIPFCHPAVHSFPMSSGWPPSGVIAFLTTNNGKGICGGGHFDVISSSTEGSYDSGRIYSFNDTSSYCSCNRPNQWIGYHFDKMKFTPHGYSIRTSVNSTNSCHLKSWMLEATNDFTAPSWTELDHRENNSTLNGSSVHASFPITSPSKARFSYVRLRMIRPAHDGSSWLYIAGFELFGELVTIE
jgi:hypothetical protein